MASPVAFTTIILGQWQQHKNGVWMGSDAELSMQVLKKNKHISVSILTYFKSGLVNLEKNLSYTKAHFHTNVQT